MENIEIKPSKDMEEAAGSLASNLAQSEPFVRYKQAIQALDADPKASDLLQRLALAQADLRTRQFESNVPQEVLINLRDLQQTARVNEIILNYSQTQQAAIAYIREINQEISQLLGVDFGSLARRSCC